MNKKEETEKASEPSENATDTEEDTTETEQEISIETQETPSETMPREDRSIPSQTSQMSVTQEQLQNYILSRLLQGASYRTVAEETGMAKTTLHKYYPKNYVDKIRLDLQKQQEEKLRTQQAPLRQAPWQQMPRQPIYQEPSLDQSALPHGSIVLTPQMIGNIRSGLNTTQQRHFDMAMNIASQYQDQLLTGPQMRGQPFPQGSIEQEEAGLLRAMARRVRFRTYQDLTTDNPRKNPGSTETALKQAADFIKFGASLVAPNKQQDPLGIYRSGRADAKGDLAHQGKSGESNPYDLRLEELRQGHDIDMHRISFEQKKFFLGLQNEEKKWDKITEVFGPILQSAGPEIRKAIRQVGEQVGRGFAGATKPNTQKPNMVATECPKCHSPLNIPIPEEAKDSVNVKCPRCGEMFQMTQDEEETEERTELRPKSGRLGSRYT